LNRDSDRTYQYVYGDKDTFMIGAIQAGANVGVVPHAVFRVKGAALIQQDFDGQWIFTHACHAKWKPGKPSHITAAHFPNLQEAHGFYNKILPTVTRRERVDEMQFLDEEARGEAIKILCHDMYEIKPMVGHRVPVKYIVDIGANMGAFTLHAALTYPESEILTVEASQKCMELVQANTRGTTATVHYVEKACVGLGMTDTVTFRRFVGRSGGSHVVMRRWAPPHRDTEESTVPAATLPQMLEEAGFPRIDILKIDCEGMEGAILTSLKETGWLKKTHWIRGEWHGQDDIPVIMAALDGAHKCRCRRHHKTHDYFIAYNREDT
jgi:FkbM family methyltransferase